MLNAIATIKSGPGSAGPIIVYHHSSVRLGRFMAKAFGSWRGIIILSAPPLGYQMFFFPETKRQPFVAIPFNVTGNM